jgi:hypothetical protein
MTKYTINVDTDHGVRTYSPEEGWEWGAAYPHEYREDELPWTLNIPAAGAGAGASSVPCVLDEDTGTYWSSALGEMVAYISPVGE